MVVSGGPMMGAPMSWEAAMNASVTKTTSGILVLPEDGAIDRRRKNTAESYAEPGESCLHSVHILYAALSETYVGTSAAAAPHYAENGYEHAASG